MLENDPPPGTKVYFAVNIQKGLRTLKAYEAATLKKRGGYVTESPADLFEVEYQGETYQVRRDQIVRISAAV